MNQDFEHLLDKVNELHDLDKVTWLLSWDREVIMPSAAAEVRAKQLATVSKLRHELYTSDEMGERIEKAAGATLGSGLDPDSMPSRLIQWLQRDYHEKRKVPADFVKRRSEASGLGIETWKAAREENQFSIFEPSLQTSIELARELAEYLASEDDNERYDAVLSQFERGIKTANVRETFDALKAETKPLIEAIGEKANSVDGSLLYQTYDVETQKKIAPYFATAVGYDFSKGHLGTAAHPFASSMSRDDARITTRWNPNFISPAIFGVMHESGHAMYEQGTGAELERTPLARGTSMGIHESQSRMFENLVGRSRGFWAAHFSVLQDAFPAQLGDATVEAFYRAINRVHPSFIRVEADELTYNMHIILRFELEQDMLNGDINAKDVPEIWNQKMDALLGITPPTDTVGCLQDIHWSSPSFGYFPTYALGNLYSVQLLNAAITQNSEIESELAAGKVTALKAWLVENVHQHGSKFDPPELIQRITGGKLSHEPFVAYAKEKFGAIYGGITDLTIMAEGLTENSDKLDEAKKRIDQARADLETRLDLTGLGLTELPSELFDLHQLQHLSLRGNRLSTFPAEVQYLANLVQLSAPDNGLLSLPEEMGNLKQLTRLNLRNNQIEALPIALLDLSGLQLLRLDGNKLPIPKDIIAKWDRPQEILTYYKENCVVLPEPAPPTLTEMVTKMFDVKALEGFVAYLAIPEEVLEVETHEERAEAVVHYHQSNGLGADLIDLLDVFRPGHFADKTFSPEEGPEEAEESEDPEESEDKEE